MQRIPLRTPCVKSTHEGTLQWLLAIGLFFFLLVIFGLFRSLVLGGANETSVGAGFVGLELDGVGIEAFEDLPCLFVHDATAGAGGFGGALFDAAVFAYNIIVNIGPGRHGIRHSPIPLPLFLPRQLLLPRRSRMGTLAIMIVLSLSFGGTTRHCSRSQLLLLGKTPSLRTLLPLHLLHLQPPQCRATPRFGNVETSVTFVDGGFGTGEDSCYHEHFHVA
mmetsp:Transcript_11308/g.20768  ORF Transcript_11308/g.20768 Transcript_11308/m.20768 type:complete len:220 (-) Transcript_11308:839-1498(-)